MNTKSLAEKIVEAIKTECGVVVGDQWAIKPERVIQSVIEAHQKEQQAQARSYETPAPDMRRDALRATVELLRNAAYRQDESMVRIINERDELHTTLDRTNALYAAQSDENDRNMGRLRDEIARLRTALEAADDFFEITSVKWESAREATAYRRARSASLPPASPVGVLLTEEDRSTLKSVVGWLCLVDRENLNDTESGIVVDTLRRILSSTTTTKEAK